uniref:Bcl-2 Bcl-2 homology region 1-3 domain-containing protein n=1 Tax=Oryzias sinensis TaxID=183150 RepID=A0A8C7Y4Z1_9TELE
TVIQRLRPPVSDPCSGTPTNGLRVRPPHELNQNNLSVKAAQRNFYGFVIRGVERNMDGETRYVIRSVLGHFVGRRGDFEVDMLSCREAVCAMTRAVCDVLEVHRLKYIGEPHQLISVFSSVSLFEDGIINWGRIVSLVSLGAALCQHQNRVDRGNGSLLADTVSEAIASYLLTEHRGWLEERRWDNFVDFFPSPKATGRYDRVGPALGLFVFTVGTALLCSYLVM